MTAYRVVAPLVIAPDVDGKLHYHYAGAEVESIDEKDAARLVKEGLLEKVKATRAAAADRAPKANANAAKSTAKSGTPKTNDAKSDGPPPLVAPDEDWVIYAVTQGLNEDEARELGKAELIARFAQQ